jgi:hypothetical protein
VVVKHNAGGSGQITLSKGVDLTLFDTTMWLLLRRSGTSWEEVMRSAGRHDVPPRGHIFGLTLSNNGADATNDIDIAVGCAMDSTGKVMLELTAAITRQLDVDFASGNGGRFTGSGAIANGTYHVFLLRKDSDGSITVGFDTSVSAANKPAGYTYFRRIGSIIRASAAILAFVQDGDHFRLKTAVLDINVTNPGTSAVSRTLASVPNGLRVKAVFVAWSVNTTNGESVYRQVRSRHTLGDANTTFRIATYGWNDQRGQHS